MNQVCIVRITSAELPPMAVHYRCHMSPTVSRDQFKMNVLGWEEEVVTII